MNKLTISACCLLLVGCATVSPLQRQVERMRAPEIDFRDGEVADIIIFLVETINRPSPPRGSLGLIQKPEPGWRELEDERKRTQFAELYRLCEGKTIGVNVYDCNVLDLLTFVASSVRLSVEFRNDQLVIVTKDGKVVMK